MRYSKSLLTIFIAVLLVMVGCSEETGNKSEEVNGNKENNTSVNNNNDHNDHTDNNDDEVTSAVFNETGMPIMSGEGGLSLDFFVGQTPETNDDWNDVMIFNKYAEQTNINVNFDMVPHEELEERRGLVLEGDSLPDAFHSADIPVTDISKYGQQGVFIPLNDLIDEYAPNLKEIIESHAEIENAITHPDGNIYALPTLDDPDFLAKRITSNLWYREDWLNTLNMDIPVTHDGFYEYLKAVNDDGDGDEVPLGAPSIDLLLDWLHGSFYIGNRGVEAGYVDHDGFDGIRRYYPISDEYKDMLMFVNKLYAEELIEQNIFEIESDEYFANAADGVYGSTFIQNPSLFSGESKDEYVAGMPFEGRTGGNDFGAVRHPVVNHGSFVITNVNEHPEATMRWIDHFYGEEGSELFFMGIYDETYEFVDGEYEYVDEIQHHPDGLSLEESVARYLTWPGGMYPGMTKQQLYKGVEGSDTSIEAAELLEPYITGEIWPEFIYTEEENEELESFGIDIEEYTSDMQKKFITGEASFDEWDDYVETIKSMNLDQYMKIKEEAYQRYKVDPFADYNRD